MKSLDFFIKDIEGIKIFSQYFYLQIHIKIVHSAYNTPISQMLVNLVYFSASHNHIIIDFLIYIKKCQRPPHTHILPHINNKNNFNVKPTKNGIVEIV